MPISSGVWLGAAAGAALRCAGADAGLGAGGGGGGALLAAAGFASARGSGFGAAGFTSDFTSGLGAGGGGAGAGLGGGGAAAGLGADSYDIIIVRSSPPSSSCRNATADSLPGSTCSTRSSTLRAAMGSGGGPSLRSRAMWMRLVSAACLALAANELGLAR